MTEQSMLLTLLKFAAHKTGYRSYVDACGWTAADVVMDNISADADAKISASAHLQEWRLNTEIKWH